jgi:hypothetical protein
VSADSEVAASDGWRLPDSSIVRPYMLRVFLLWVGVRMSVAIVAVFAGGIPPGDLLQWKLAGALSTGAVCVMLCHLDIRRRGELALLRNLGIHERELAVLFALSCAIGEAILALALPR